MEQSPALIAPSNSSSSVEQCSASSCFALAEVLERKPTATEVSTAALRSPGALLSLVQVDQSGLAQVVGLFKRLFNHAQQAGLKS